MKLCASLLFRLKCAAGDTINIKGVAYGRTDRNICPHEAVSDLNCKATNPMGKVLKK